jgi:hypothetical protein
MKRVRHVLLAVGMIGATLGHAEAAIPSADGVYTGCYSRFGGAVRVIDQSSACKTGEVRITWNKKGPQGPAGSVGPQGPVGPAGPK